jgi:Heme/copper-type cytochrome/quinol oxidase, subunit 3
VGDVIREAQFKGDHTRVVQISHRYGMILFIASEVMFFVAWFWAFFNSRCSRPTRSRHPRRGVRLRCRHGDGRLQRAGHLAAEGHRDLRSLASAAAQHAAAA